MTAPATKQQKTVAVAADHGGREAARFFRASCYCLRSRARNASTVLSNSSLRSIIAQCPQS